MLNCNGTVASNKHYCYLLHLISLNALSC